MKPAEQYILEQPEPYKSILLHLCLLIERNFSTALLQFKWKIPCYYIKDKPFCYLNASYKKEYVDLGFWAPKKLSKYNEFLNSEGRKVVKSLRYCSLEDINPEILIAVLQEAYDYRVGGC